MPADADLCRHRRGGVSRLAPVRSAARARAPRCLRRQPRDGLAGEHRAPARRRHFAFVHHDVTIPSRSTSPSTSSIHLAALASPIDYLRLPLHSLKVGSYGTHHALGLAKFKRARFLLASTSEVYGDPQVHPQPETLLGPRQPDRAARRLRRGEAVRRGADDGLPPAAGRRHGDRADFQHLRPADEGRTTAARSPTSSARRSTEKPLTIYGDGSQTRSFCYVDDLIRGLVLLAESGEHLPVNIGNPGEYTILELAEAVLRLTGSSSQIVYEALPGRRPAGAPARHHAREAAARLGARDRARGRAPAHARVARPGTGRCVGCLPSPRRSLFVAALAALAGSPPRTRRASSARASSTTACSSSTTPTACFRCSRRRTRRPSA